MTPEQIAFVQGQLAGGATPQQVTQLLLAHGYTSDQVADLLAVAANPIQATSTVQVNSLSVATGSLLLFGTTLSNTFARVTARGPLFLGFVTFTCLVLYSYTFHSANVTINGAASVASLILAVLSLAVGMLVMRNMLRETPVGLTEDMSWVSQNFFSCLWVNILLLLLIVSGCLLFIIPGVILSMYLLFAQPIRMSEGVRGINALVRSTELVHGHWWGVFGRVVGLTFCLGFVGGIVRTLTEVVVGATGTLTLFVNAGLQAVLGFATIALCAELYTQLSNGKQPFDATRPHPLRTWYSVFGWLSLILIPVVSYLLIMGLMSLMFGTTM